MSTDPTEIQGGKERRLSREMSLKQVHPPTQIPGYDFEKFLGAGAYGEVWVAVERNTGRKVAIKFYYHRGGLDWSLFSREVEKLAFLFADRYVVQLLGVGWEAEPPYYIMEYLQPGSLAERLREGPLPVDQAVELFREIAVGLVHAHGKGVLHCDLKPANILLDQDNKPRLADFGQSRLSHEQMPALGTMFYMAPEQADLEALPDARWDVYALGALLYCMLTGHPPYQTQERAELFERTLDLKQRLAQYREMIEQAPPVADHRKLAGVDSLLADIIDRCLAADPRERFANVQSVLDALSARQARRARRPMMVLGAIGPALLLAVVAWFAWQSFGAALRESDAALTEAALESTQFAAGYAARTASNELERRYQVVEQLAQSDGLREAVENAWKNADFKKLADSLSDPKLSVTKRKSLAKQFRDDPTREKLQSTFKSFIPPAMQPSEEDEVTSWFFCDAAGLSTVRIPKSRTIGKNYAWRSFFHGGPRDLDESWRADSTEHITKTTLSAVFISQATSQWTVAISTPMYDDSPKKKFLGVVALTIQAGRFLELRLRSGDPDRFAVLVDTRPGENPGVILQHPLFDKWLSSKGSLPENIKNYRLSADELPDVPERQRRYHDPLAADPEGKAYRRHWLAWAEPVEIRGENTGWVVIVQDAYYAAIGNTLDKLTAGLFRYG
ncbi:MAG: protein kinase domain-containing protein, partial [Thermoguttaceae bacterium]